MGISDVDEQMKQRQAAQRMQEEQTAYGRISALTGVKNRNAYRVYEERLNAQIEIFHSHFNVTLV